MVDPYAIVRRLTGHELISPKDARLLTEAVDGLIDEIGSKDARIAELEAALHIATNDKLSLLDQLDQAQQARMAQIDYGCDLQRIIEDLCRGGPIREPKTSARHHYNMAVEALSRTGAVKVKPLEWTRGWMNAEAQTEIGQYTITYRRDGSFEWGIGILKGWASSWDEAKAAAQADFERRILSALTAGKPEPVPSGEHRYAERLLIALMEKHYPDRSPEWAPLPDLMGILTQIDNLTTGLVRAAPTAEAARRALTGGVNVG